MMLQRHRDDLSTRKCRQCNKATGKATYKLADSHGVVRVDLRISHSIMQERISLDEDAELHPVLAGKLVIAVWQCQRESR